MNSRQMSNIFLGIINDLKRRPEDAATDLGITLDEIKSILSGEKELSHDLITKATGVWPVNAGDFYPFRDDAQKGVKIMRKEESQESGRIMHRAGMPYYKYWDTVMSSVAPFRPELIEELCEVDDNDPNNPLIQWNNGHFMHQFTYFIGPVNFYFVGPDGGKNVAVMSTGDSMYITPFIPHTFTTRKNTEGKKGLILALTYGDKLAGDSKKELSALGPELARQFAMDFSTIENAFSSLLKYHREASSVSIGELAGRVGLNSEILTQYESGTFFPDYTTIKKIAEALTINLRDLLPLDRSPERVIVRKHNLARKWLYPSDAPVYSIVELTGTPSLPHSKAIELSVNTGSGSRLELKVGLHQYCYNVGITPLTMNWENGGQYYSETVNPGDSFYIKPFVPHNFRGEGKLLILRVGGRVAGDPQREFSYLNENALDRVFNKTMQWFNPEGRQNV